MDVPALPWSPLVGARVRAVQAASGKGRKSSRASDWAFVYPGHWHQPRAFHRLGRLLFDGLLGAAPEHIHALGLAVLYWWATDEVMRGGWPVAACGWVRSEAQLSNLDESTSVGGKDYQVIGGNSNAHVLSRL